MDQAIALFVDWQCRKMLSTQTAKKSAERIMSKSNDFFFYRKRISFITYSLCTRRNIKKKVPHCGSAGKWRSNSISELTASEVWAARAYRTTLTAIYDFITWPLLDITT